MKQNKTKKSHAEKNVELINWREKLSVNIIKSQQWK